MSLGIPEMSLAALLEYTFTTTEYFLLSFLLKLIVIYSSIEDDRAEIYTIQF